MVTSHRFPLGATFAQHSRDILVLLPCFKRQPVQPANGNDQPKADLPEGNAIFIFRRPSPSLYGQAATPTPLACTTCHSELGDMRGAPYLCPLLRAEDPNATQSESNGSVAAVAVDGFERAVNGVTQEDVARLSALLGGLQSELVPRSGLQGVSADVTTRLPLWAQSVVRSGCFDKPMKQQAHHHKRSSHSEHGQHGEDDEGTPRKRPRAFQKKEHLRIRAMQDLDSDEAMPSSQDTEAADEEDEGPLRSMFTNEERVAEHVDKYSEMLGRLLDSAQQRRDELHAHGDDVDTEIDLFSATEIKALVQSIKVMDKSSLISKCDPELLLALMQTMDRQIQIGVGVDVLGTMALNQGDEEWQASGMDLRLMARVQSCLDVGICELLVMATPDIDRRILSEETIENCVQLLNHAVQRLILPCIDPTSTLISASSSSTRASSDGGGGFVSPRTEKAPKNRGSGAKHFNVKSNKNVKKAMDRLVPVVCEFMEQLARLISAVKLADRWILHFSGMMTKLFLLDVGSHATLLQRSALHVLRAVFVGYESHRSLMLDDVVSVMLKLPTAKRNLRTVKLIGSNSMIQMITSLIVVLVQATAASSSAEQGAKSNASDHDPTLLPEGAAVDDDEEDEDEAGTGESKDNEAVVRMKAARESARIFVASLLKECMKKNEERDNRVVLENLLEDLLVMFGRPEWAGAEVLLEVLSTSLASILGANLTKDAKKLESQYSLTALNLVGRICASIKVNETVVARDGLDEDESRPIFDEHAAYVKDTLEGYWIANGDGKKLGNDVDRELVLKHMVLTYMKRNLHDVTHDDARRMLLTRFMLEKTSGPGSRYASEMWKSYWETSGGIDSTSKLASPHLDFAVRASLHGAVTREFARMFDALMKHLMALLSRGIPTFRARVMKALSGIVDVDPMLMAEAGVRTTVARCFLDEATSVRQAAIDLVGKYVTLQPLLFDRYFEMLSDRLRDKGISVRKSVCKIFRVYLTSTTALSANGDSLSDSELRRRSSCMRNLVQRIGDATEEDVVKNFIIDTFQEAWFGAELSARQLSGVNDFEDEPTVVKSQETDAPPGWTAVESTNDDVPISQLKEVKAERRTFEFISPDGRVYGSAEEAWAAFRTPLVTPSSVVKTKRSKLDDTPATVSTIIEVLHGMATMDWFVALLKRLLHDDKFKSSASKRASRDRSDDASIARERSEKIVASLIECLVQLEEGKTLQGVTVSDMEAQFLSCVKALNAFSEACPTLLTPHLEVVMVYLKGDDKLSKPTEAKVQGLIVGMLSNVIAHVERVSDRVANGLEGDLKNLIFRAPPSVVGPSIKCLATLSNHTKRPPTLLFKLLGEFFKYLDKFQNVTTLATVKPDAISSLQRALFAAGQIGGALDFDNCGFELPVSSDLPLSKLVKGSIMDALYEVYSAFLRIPGSPACTAKAVQGLGFLFMLRPRFLLQTQQDGLFDTLLRSPSHEIRLQTLTSMKELLQHEEQRLEKGATRKKTNAKDKSKKGQVQGDQDGEGSLIGGVMQAQLENILVLSLEKHVRIRSEAVSCIAVLLTQGLVSPLHCIPNLVALEADQVVSIRDIAHGQLIALHEKFPTLLPQPSIQGVFLSHSFQLKAFDSCTVFALDKDKKEYCLFGRLYTTCLRPLRTQRTMFLRSLINQFSDKGTVLSPANLQSKALKTLDYLSYLAQLVTALPYDVEDEPLFIIYQINRYVTLKLGSTLQDLRKEFKALGVNSVDLTDEDTDLSALDISPFLQDEYDNSRISALQAKCAVGFAINLLLRIKFFLKDLYALDNEKCQTYQPGSATKLSDQPVLVSEHSPPKLQLPSSDDLKVAHPLELSWRLMLHTWQAAQEDQNQLDFEAVEEVSRLKKKKPSRRRKSVIKNAHVDDDEEEVEGFDG